MNRHLIALLLAYFALSGAPVFAADMLAPFEKSDGKWGLAASMASSTAPARWSSTPSLIMRTTLATGWN